MIQSSFHTITVGLVDARVAGWFAQSGAPCAIEAVRRTRTTIVLETVKETSAVRLDGLDPETVS